MTGVLNPWSLLAGVLLILASFGTGVKVGVKWNEGEHLAAMAEQQKLTALWEYIKVRVLS